MRARVALATAALLAAVAMASCGEKQETLGSAQPEPFDLALDFYVNPDHAGIFTAIDNGYFERVGLAVSPRCCSPATRASRSRRWGRSSTSRSPR